MGTLNTIKLTRLAKETEDRKILDRKKSILVLIQDYLLTNGYIQSANALISETEPILQRNQICDNVDLESVVHDFEAYYFTRFGKYPKLFKPINSDSSNKQILPVSKRRISKCNAKSRALEHSAVDYSDLEYEQHLKNVETESLPTSFSVEGKQVFANAEGNLCHASSDETYERTLKSISSIAGQTTEWMELAQIISRDIIQKSNIHWDDIVGLDDAKRLLNESVVQPIKYSDLFTGILSPWRGLLLYGPPGTGKTMLAKAVATECNTTFFNVSASTVISKWRGDSEKLIRVLFELAKFHAPSTIFFDEIDSLMNSRGVNSNHCEHEASRRMKTELLIQMDGIHEHSEIVFVLAATNLPWDLDSAFLRRVQKRILIDMPDAQLREAIFKLYLTPTPISWPKFNLKLTAELNYSKLALESEGYSGCDIKTVCKEAAMKKLRDIINRLESDSNAHKGQKDSSFSLEPLLTSDVELALQSSKPSAKNLSARYLEWKRKFESR